MRKCDTARLSSGRPRRRARSARRRPWRPPGCCATIHVARVLARVRAGEDDVVVHDVDERPARPRTTAASATRSGDGTRRRRSKAHHGAPRREQDDERVGGQRPAREEAVLRAHEDEEQDRRRQQQHRGPVAAQPQPEARHDGDRAAGSRRAPTAASARSRSRPRVAGRPSLPQSSPDAADCSLSPLRKSSKLSSAYGLRTRKATTVSDAGEAEADQPLAPRARRQRGGGEQRARATIPAVYLVAIASPRPAPASR